MPRRRERRGREAEVVGEAQREAAIGRGQDETANHPQRAVSLDLPEAVAIRLLHPPVRVVGKARVDRDLGPPLGQQPGERRQPRLRRADLRWVIVREDRDSHERRVNTSEDGEHAAEAARVERIYRRYARSRRRRRAWAADNPGNLALRAELLAAIRSAAAAELAGEHRILDAGCGNGRWLEALQREGIRSSRLVGVDVQRQRLDQARRRVPGAQLELVDVRQLPFDDDSFGLVLALTLLSSLDSADSMRRGLSELDAGDAARRPRALLRAAAAQPVQQRSPNAVRCRPRRCRSPATRRTPPDPAASARPAARSVDLLVVPAAAAPAPATKPPSRRVPQAVRRRSERSLLSARPFARHRARRAAPARCDRARVH